MKTRTPEGQALTELVLESLQFNSAMLDVGNKLAKPEGLTSGRWQVLGAIEAAGHAVTVAQLGRRMCLARQGVRRIVHDLERLGMITLVDNPDHKRAPLVSISEEGTRVMASIEKVQIRWANQISDGLTERQVRQTLKILQIIRKRSATQEI